MRRRNIPGGLLLCLAAASCMDSPVGPPAVEVQFASAEAINAFIPAIKDARMRILPTAEDVERRDRMMAELGRLQEALIHRDGPAALRSLDTAQDELDACDADCLIAPERTILHLMLDYTRGLMGLSPAGGVTL